MLSLGAIQAPDSMIEELDEEDARIENDVYVHRIRVFEDPFSSEMVAVDGSSSFLLSQIPLYYADAWVEDVYGEPPAWLTYEETEKWYAERFRDRIEWFVTLVPASQWSAYIAHQDATVESALENNESPLQITEINVDADSSTHSVSVRSLSDGETRLWGVDDLSSTNWIYKGFSLQSAGTTTAGANSTNNQMFVMATFSESSMDSDEDGIPDVVEEKVYGTDPHRADTSGDGISDWVKAYVYELNPRVSDTSGDGIGDDEKIVSHSDPRTAVSEAEKEKARFSVRYYYDDDDRLIGTWFGLGNGATTTALSPAGNPDEVHRRTDK